MTSLRSTHFLSKYGTSGIAAVEFALVCPVFFLMFVGFADVGQMVYGKSILNGAVQAAARSASLESADTSKADQMVVAQVRNVLKNVNITSTRTSYYDFADIGRPEQWNDSDANGRCNDGETYTDENSNGNWDSDVGSSGNGGANDVVIYSVLAEYEPMFDLPILPGWNKRTLSATAIRKNQPYANQEGYSSKAETC